MKILFKSNIILLTAFTALLLFSCKQNQDGYSDEVQTRQTPVDSAGNAVDSTNSGTEEGNINTTTKNGSVGKTPAGSLSAGGNSSSGTNSTGNSSSGTSSAGNDHATSGTKGTGTGGGPGESPKDGVTYSPTDEQTDANTTSNNGTKKKSGDK
jgi:hypothetical protein